MTPNFAVSWKNSKGAVDAGRLEFGPHSLRLAGATTVEIPYSDVVDVSLGRGSGDRLRGRRRTVVLARRNGRPIWIAPVAYGVALHELHDRLQGLTHSAE